jgi:subtilisin family serine protease
MRRFPLVLLSALYLGACASAAPAPPASPVPGDVGTPQDPASADPVTPPPAAGEPITAVPDRWWLLDPETDGIYGAAVDRAYRELLQGRSPARTVVVAIIDSGVEVEHEDLRDNVWRNPRETRNQRDDDGDGLIDDIFGWNYIGGPDGRHVDDDTYEVTRLYAACARLFGNMPPPPPPAAQRPVEPVTREECPGIEEGYYEKVQETRQMLGQIGQMHETVGIIVGLLQAHLGTQELTVEAVRNVAPLRNDLRQARDIYLQLAAANITPKMIADELDRLERLLTFGLNPEFDPRPIVGDNYADPAERVYGNGDVVGPDARHGTGVAGIVAAGRDNQLGTDGIASGTQVMALRAVPNGDERDKDIANAIRYAVDHGAHIINMSFGKGYSPFKGAVDEAVRYAEQRGVLLVHAAGNDAKDLATERNYPNRYLLTGDTARLWLEVGASSWRGIQQLRPPPGRHLRARLRHPVHRAGQRVRGRLGHQLRRAGRLGRGRHAHGLLSGAHRSRRAAHHPGECHAARRPHGRTPGFAGGAGPLRRAVRDRCHHQRIQRRAHGGAAVRRPPQLRTWPGAQS